MVVSAGFPVDSSLWELIQKKQSRLLWSAGVPKQASRLSLGSNIGGLGKGARALCETSTNYFNIAIKAGLLEVDGPS